MVMTGRFTFDKVVSSGELSGPLGYQGIHHIILLFIPSHWNESYQIDTPFTPAATLFQWKYHVSSLEMFDTNVTVLEPTRRHHYCLQHHSQHCCNTLMNLAQTVANILMAFKWSFSQTRGHWQIHCEVSRWCALLLLSKRDNSIENKSWSNESVAPHSDSWPSLDWGLAVKSSLPHNY